MPRISTNAMGACAGASKVTTWYFCADSYFKREMCTSSAMIAIILTLYARTFFYQCRYSSDKMTISFMPKHICIVIFLFSRHTHFFYFSWHFFFVHILCCIIIYKHCGCLWLCVKNNVLLSHFHLTHLVTHSWLF